MKENVTYGECLAEILKAFDVKCSRLAREINIDSSLIYKWLRNERVPPYDSLYIDLILNFLSKKLVNPFQKESVIEMLESYGVELHDTGDERILINLRRMLENSQGYSIRLRNKIKSEHKLRSTNMKSAAEPSANNFVIRNKEAFVDFDNVRIVRGSTAVIDSAVNLLMQTPKTPPIDENTILITLNNDLRLQLFTRDLYLVCIKTLLDLLNGGWKCILHTMLDSNPDRTLKIIEGFQSLLTTGNLSIYYYFKQSCKHENAELLIIPQGGAMLSFPTQKSNEIDSAFLFRSKSSVDILSSRFFRNLDSAKLLIKPFPSQKSAEFQHAFADYEEAAGEKCVLKGGLSTVTIPSDLYEKYMKLNGASSHELFHRRHLHRRRIDSFKEHVAHYRFRDICFTESIVDLVENRIYSFDEKYMTQNYLPGSSDIVYHLEYLVDLLETYDNYNIAFISKKHFQHISNINWMVKSNSCVLIEALSSCKSLDYLDNDRNYLISEISVVKAFCDYFNILWDKIPYENKNKKNSIEWLRSLIQKYKASP